MIITVNGLVISVLKAIGVCGEGEEPDGYYTNAALHELNSLDVWSLIHLNKVP